MTRDRVNGKGEGMAFADIEEVQRAYSNGIVELQAKIKVRINEIVVDEDGNKTESTELVDTTAGRAILFDIVPKGLPFALVNQDMKKRTISQLINACYRRLGLKIPLFLLIN